MRRSRGDLGDIGELLKQPRVPILDRGDLGEMMGRSRRDLGKI